MLMTLLMCASIVDVDVDRVYKRRLKAMHVHFVNFAYQSIVLHRGRDDWTKA